MTRTQRGILDRIVSVYRRVSDDGFAPYLKEKLDWLQKSWKMDNWLVGRYVELRGNQVDLGGVRISLDNPIITTPQKSTIFHGYYEVEEQGLLRDHLPRNLPVVEMGGGIGFVSCLVNRMLERPSHHVVVEANPQLIPTIEENRRLNDCSFSVINRALAYDQEEVHVFVPDSFVYGNVTGDGNRTALVPSTTLRDLVETANFDVFTLVMDIEGAEVDLVEREGDLLAARAFMLAAEWHPMIRSEQAVTRALKRLERLGFEEIARAGATRVLLNRSLVKSVQASGA